MTGARPSKQRRPKRLAHGWKLPAAALLAAVSLMAGCSLVIPPSTPALPEAPVIAEISRARELAQALVERGRELTSMQTAAVMEYREADRHVKAREQIMVRRPGSLRVEALSPFGLAMVMAANDSHLQIFEPSTDTLYKGEASAQSLSRFAQIPLAPKPAVNLLMGLAPDGDALLHAPDSVGAEGGLLIATYKSADGSITEIGFRGPQLALVRERSENGIECEVRYSDYRDIGGFQFAHRVEADFPRARTHVNFTYRGPIINGTLADSLFALTPGPATKQVDLNRTGVSSAAVGLDG